MSARGRSANRSARKIVSNLPERKRAVLRIASENFLFVKRLERIRSAIGPGGSQKHLALSASRRQSIAKAYPNILDTRRLFTLGNVQKTPRREPPKIHIVNDDKFKKNLTKLAPLDA